MLLSTERVFAIYILMLCPNEVVVSDRLNEITNTVTIESLRDIR